MVSTVTAVETFFYKFKEAEFSGVWLSTYVAAFVCAGNAHLAHLLCIIKHTRDDVMMDALHRHQVKTHMELRYIYNAPHITSHQTVSYSLLKMK